MLFAGAERESNRIHFHPPPGPRPCEEAVKVFPDLPDNPPQVLIKKRTIQYPWGLSDPKFEFFHSLAASCKEAAEGAGGLGFAPAC